MNYNLTINKKQALLIKVALEEYFRIRMNQWSDLAEDLAIVGFTYNKDDPENDQKFDNYLRRREYTKAMLEQAMMAAQPQRAYEMIPISEECCVAHDIWQVIRHQLYLDNGGDPNGWVVDARPPLSVSDEPLPVMKKEG